MNKPEIVILDCEGNEIVKFSPLFLLALGLPQKMRPVPGVYTLRIDGLDVESWRDPAEWEFQITTEEVGK